MQPVIVITFIQPETARRELDDANAELSSKNLIVTRVRKAILAIQIVDHASAI